MTKVYTRCERSHTPSHVTSGHYIDLVAIGGLALATGPIYGYFDVAGAQGRGKDSIVKALARCSLCLPSLNYRNSLFLWPAS